MAKRASAKRYAQAAFEIALERRELDKWLSDLKKVASLSQDASLIAWFENPKLRFNDKAKLLSDQLKDINPLVLNLVLLLMARGTLHLLSEVADHFQYLLDVHHGIERAEVITAVSLDDRDKTKLSERLGTMVGKKVMVESEVDPALVGGFVARIGGKYVDASAQSRLEALKKEISRVSL